MRDEKKSDFRIAFGKRLQTLRRSKNVSQEALGDMLEVHFVSISRWERGIHVPTIDQLVFMADFFEVTTDYLLGLDTEVKAVSKKKKHKKKKKKKDGHLSQKGINNEN